MPSVEKGYSNFHKLTIDDVVAIKRRIADDEPLMPIAADYGVGVNAVSAIRWGRTWTWVEGPPARSTCALCGGELTGQRRRFCSRKCAVGFHCRTDAHVLRRRQYSRERKLFTRGAAKGHTEAQWLALLESHQGRCGYCGAVAAERDHVIPLALGGSDSIENIMPACRRCNASKNKTPLAEWLTKEATTNTDKEP